MGGSGAAELLEIEKLEKFNPGTVKAFLSSEKDLYRPPYARAEVEVVRRTVFVGTTNEDDFLRDLTGNRRYAVVECPGEYGNIAWLKENRDRIWAHAYHLAIDESVKHYIEHDDPLLAEATETQKKFTRTDYWGERVAEFVQEGWGAAAWPARTS